MLKQHCAARFASLLLAASLAATPPAVAQSYPSELVRIVVGAGAGSPPDIVARVVANELGESEGWRVVIENKLGGPTGLAGAEVLKQPADGYSILAIALATTVAPALSNDISYRLDADFSPVIKLVTAHQVLVVNPSVPAKSLTELVHLLKEQPDKFNFSSGGFGTPAHLAGEVFKLQTGVRVAHVPYRSPPQMISDLINGTNHYQFITPLLVLDLVAVGKLRAVAVTGSSRIAALKDVPTVIEAGYPDLVIQDWFGLVVKKGTPDAVIVRLNEAINQALAKPAVRAALAKIATEPAGGSAAEFGALVKAQMAHWGKMVKDSGIKANRQ